MALQSSGAISISQIRNEQVNYGGFGSTYSLRALSSNAGKNTPDAMSEFYGYSAAPPPTLCIYYICTSAGYYYYFGCSVNSGFNYNYFEYGQGVCATDGGIDTINFYNSGNQCLA